MTDRALARLPLADAVNIELTAHQWWWEAKYGDVQPSRVFSTANELHIPVGRPVVMTLLADDVIHSFWVPNLHGKKDLIPGHTSLVSFRADQAGTYRGQCAEFCGYQHANMALEIIAEPPEQYERWLQQQRQSASPPAEPQLRRGYEVFVRTTCAMCHAVVGSEANGQRAPDLTHLASRRTIASGMLANNAGNLAAWVLNAPQLKPGVNMPPNPLPPDDLRALLAYLASLK
jgi:cytochrome c oxidase subunit 2